MIISAIESTSYPKSNSIDKADTTVTNPLKPVENIRRLSAVSEDVNLKNNENNKYFSKLKGVN